MQKISSALSIFLKKNIPAFALVLALLYAMLMIFVHYTFKELAGLFSFIVFLTLSWTFSIRNMEEVYLEDDKLVVRDNKILFENIVLFVNDFGTILVKYKDQDSYKSFKFKISDFGLSFQSNNIKRLKVMIEESNVDSGSVCRFRL